jgi:hypothetical protein
VAVAVLVVGAGVPRLTFEGAALGDGDVLLVAVRAVEIVGAGVEAHLRGVGVGGEHLDREVDLEAAEAPAVALEEGDDLLGGGVGGCAAHVLEPDGPVREELALGEAGLAVDVDVGVRVCVGVGVGVGVPLGGAVGAGRALVAGAGGEQRGGEGERPGGGEQGSGWAHGDLRGECTAPRLPRVR